MVWGPSSSQRSSLARVSPPPALPARCPSLSRNYFERRRSSAAGSYVTSNDAIGSPPLRCMVIAIHVRQLGSRRRALAPRRIRASQRALERWHALRRRALRRRELQATALAFCQVVGPARACSSNASCLLAHVLAVFLRARASDLGSRGGRGTPLHTIICVRCRQRKRCAAWTLCSRAAPIFWAI